MSEIPITFRRATSADVPEIVRMLADDALGAKRERFAEPLPKSYMDAFEAISADDRNELYVAESGGKIIGTLQLTFIPYLNHQGGWRALIESVHVASDMRGKGIGSTMMRFAIERARTRGCRIVQLTTDKTRVDAKRFYEKLGFRATHEGMKFHLVEGSHAGL
jgi:ribosomal protein S18 acetylase RimI-like enzyme